MSKNILAVLSGTVTMVVIDLLLARVTHTGLTIGISASVFVGAVVASLLVEKHGWFLGLLVGGINCCITLGFYYWLSPQVPLRDVVVRPMVLSLVFGAAGGAIVGWLKKRSKKSPPNIL